MPPAIIFILAPIFLVIVIAGIVYSAKKAQERREALMALASELGLQFDPQRDRYHDDEYAHFEIFRKGHSRSAYNTLQGRIELAGLSYAVKMGDFKYKVTHGSGKNRRTSTYHFSYAILHLPYVGVPDLLVRKEGVFDKIAGAIGFDDIDFESVEFSKRFLVKGPNKRFAYDIIHPRMMEFLMQGASPMVDIERDRCCLMNGKRRWAAADFRAMLEWADGFFGLWPEHVTAELTQRSEASV